MSLMLPTDPPPMSMGIGIVSTMNTLTPAAGGDDQDIRRKGSRYALTFTVPMLDYVDSMDWDDLNAEGETVVMQVHQPGLVIGNPGAPRVDSGGQIGASIFLKGLSAGYVIRKGQFLSIITGGQRFLYRARAVSVANGVGDAWVQLRHLLRRPPADNDVVEIAQPMIEGFPRDVRDVEVGVDHQVALQFTVRERE